MLITRRAEERGGFDGIRLARGTLDTRHTFSFGEYHDPDWMGFRALRVINDDVVSPGAGFPTHPHRDMEIITWVLEGELEHKDSTGGGGVIRPGELQRMSAGSGVTHSEFNGSRDEPVHLLQMWIIPRRDALGAAPSYEQKSFPEAERRGKLRVIASPDGAAGSATIRADARVHVGFFRAGGRATLRLAKPQGLGNAWAHVARGEATINGERCRAGDAVGLVDEPELVIEGVSREGDAEVLVFELA